MSVYTRCLRFGWMVPNLAIRVAFIMACFLLLYETGLLVWNSMMAPKFGWGAEYVMYSSLALAFMAEQKLQYLIDFRSYVTALCHNFTIRYANSGPFFEVGLFAQLTRFDKVLMNIDIDANGIVNVGAKDKATNKEQNITIQSSGGLSDDQVEQMVRDAETFAGKDKERKALIEAKNDADTLLYSAEKSLHEHKEKLPADIVSQIETAIADLRTVKDGDDLEAIKSKIQDVQNATMKIGEAINKAAGGGGDGGSSDAGSASGEEEKKEEQQK